MEKSWKAGPAIATGERTVWFSPERPATAKVYQRAQLKPGQIISGPAVIEQLDTTTLIFSGDTSLVDNALNLLIQVKT